MAQDSNLSPVGSAVNAAIELALQPHVVPTTGGGSGSAPSKKMTMMIKRNEVIEDDKLLKKDLNP